MHEREIDSINKQFYNSGLPSYTLGYFEENLLNILTHVVIKLDQMNKIDTKAVKIQAKREIQLENNLHSGKMTRKEFKELYESYYNMSPEFSNEMWLTYKKVFKNGR